MAGHNAIKCPHCRVKLNIKNKSAFGKRKRCPQCSELFVVPKPQREPVVEVIDDFEEVDDFGDPGGFDDFGHSDDDYGYEAPPPRRPARRKRSKKPAGKPAWVKPTAIAGISVLGLLVLAGAVFLAVKAFRGSSRDMPGLAVLAEESEVLMVIRVNELPKTGPFKKAYEGLAKMPDFANMLKDSGQTVDDIEMIAMGLNDVSRLKQMNANFQPGDAIVLVRVSRPFDKPKILRRSEKKRHNGLDYFKDKNSRMGDAAGYFVDDRTIVVSTEASIKRILDRKSTPSIDKSRFGFVDFDQPIVFAYAPKSGKVLPPEYEEMSKQVPANMQQAARVLEKVRGVAVGMTFSNGVGLKIQAVMPDDSAASQAADDLKSLLQTGRQFVDQFRGKMQPAQQQIVDSVFNNTRIAAKGSSVTVTTQLPESAMRTLEGFGNPAGGFGSRPRRFR